jgi:hypothetical protein
MPSLAAPDQSELTIGVGAIAHRRRAHIVRPRASAAVTASARAWWFPWHTHEWPLPVLTAGDVNPGDVPPHRGVGGDAARCSKFGSYHSLVHERILVDFDQF